MTGAPDAVPVRADASPRGQETVLLVEDDAGVRAITATILRGQGYTVFDASNGAEALRLCQAGGPAFDLLLTDSIMPHMGGRELADRLTARWPQLRVLFMSGYTEDRILRQRVIDDRDAFIQKPFKASELARRVRDVLDASPTSGPGAT